MRISSRFKKRSNKRYKNNTWEAKYCEQVVFKRNFGNNWSTKLRRDFLYLHPRTPCVATVTFIHVIKYNQYSPNL